MQLADLTVKGFLDKTASNEPVPGGGSISALNGAIASALAEMVANLTIGRKKYVEVEDIMKELAPKFDALRERMVQDIDRVFDAFKLPKETDEEKELRKQAIQRETIYAAQVPMEVARAVAGILPAIATVARKGNQNAVTDACVAMMCARNAVLGALLNVRINLTSIDDKEFVAQMAKEANQLEKEAIEQEAEIMKYVKEQIGI